MSERVNLGKVAMTLGGAYDSTQSYDKLTCVHYDGCSWVSKKRVPEGVAPTLANSAYWQKISDRGIQGPQGQSYVDKELVPIVNDLTTGGSSNVLSAEQGKVLDTKLTELSDETDARFNESAESTREQIRTLEDKADNKLTELSGGFEDFAKGVEYVLGNQSERIEQINTGLSEEIAELSKRIDNLPKGDEFDKQSNYPSLHVGTADDLAGRGESVPAEFGFRASGGKSIKDGRAYIKAIKGNSVVWNQKVAGELRVQDGTMSQSGNRYAITPTGEYAGIQTEITELIQGHKYICLCSKVGGSKPLYLNWGGYDSLANAIFEVTNVNKTYCTIYAINENETFTLTRPIICDLTQMFQAGNEPTTIEEYNARKPIVADEYAYNEGEVIHCNTESIESIGDNAWDEQWEVGHINYNTGVDTPDSWRLRTKDYIRVLPNEEYHLSLPTTSYPSDLVVICYDENKAFIQHIGGGSANKTFRIPTNCHYIRFTWDGTQYANNIMLTLVHSGWKQDTDAGYQPYWQDSLPLPIIRKYFPDGMKKAVSAHDEIRFNKATNKWEYSKGKIKSVDLGGVEWNYDSDSIFIAVLNDMNPTVNTARGIMAKYNLCSSLSGSTMLEGDDKTYVTNGGWVGGGGRVTIKDTDYTDAASFKASLQGVMFYYEAAEWEWVELDAEDQNFRDYYQVADFGTEQSQSNVPSAAFSADIIYQFNAVDMIREHELEITELQSIIATMQAQLASLTNS